MGRPRKPTLPAVIEPDVGRSIRRQAKELPWWDQRNDPRDAMAAKGLLSAVSELGHAATAHLMRRMVNKSTPVAVKDAIALAITPKLQAEFKGRLPTGGEAESGPQGEGVDAVQQAYGLKIG